MYECHDGERIDVYMWIKGDCCCELNEKKKLNMQIICMKLHGILDIDGVYLNHKQFRRIMSLRRLAYIR